MLQGSRLPFFSEGSTWGTSSGKLSFCPCILWPSFLDVSFRFFLELSVLSSSAFSHQLLSNIMAWMRLGSLITFFVCKSAKYQNCPNPPSQPDGRLQSNKYLHLFIKLIRKREGRWCWFPEQLQLRHVLASAEKPDHCSDPRRTSYSVVSFM